MARHLTWDDEPETLAAPAPPNPDPAPHKLLAQQPPAAPRKGEDIGYKLGVSLKDLYNGKTTKMKVIRNVVCGTCKGKGSEKEGVTKKCDSCGGTGVTGKVIRLHIAPGMIHQQQQPCGVCLQRGEIIPEKDRCNTCSGHKLLQESKVLNLVIEKGTHNNEKVVFYGEGEQAPGLPPGDVVIQVREMPEKDSPWERQGDDLIYTHKITLLQALTGFEFHLHHLDDRVLVVKSEPDTVVKPGDVKVIDNEGMPIKGRGLQKGRLFIKLDVAFPTPEELKDDKKRSTFRDLLSHREDLPMPPREANVEEFMAKAYTMQPNQHQQGESDEQEEENGARPATCTSIIM